MFRSQPCILYKSLVRFLPSLLALLSFTTVARADTEVTAWQKLLAEHPEAAADPKLSRLERRVLQVLTPEQAEIYAAGGQLAESLLIPSGETLDEFIERAQRVDASGLLYKPLVPCRILDTRRTATGRTDGTTFYLRVRGPRKDYSHWGGNADGCGLPDLRGKVLLTNTARALMLSIEVDEALGPGTIELWPANASPRPGLGLVSYDQEAGPGPRQSLVVAMCDEENISPCELGDVALSINGAAAHLIVDVIGYFEPLWSAITNSSDGPLEISKPQSWVKAATAPYWEQGGNPADIHYSDGRVGVGTAIPTATVHVSETGSQANIYAERTDGHFVGLLSGSGWSGLAYENTSYFSIGPVGMIGGVPNRTLTITPDKNVGIGTTDPDTRLTVYGTAHLRSNNPVLRFTDRSVVEGEPGEVWNLRNQNSSFKIYEASKVNNPAFFIRNDGNVGIQTTQPDEALQVDGNVKLTGSILSDNDICIGNCN